MLIQNYPFNEWIEKECIFAVLPFYLFICVIFSSSLFVSIKYYY